MAILVFGYVWLSVAIITIVAQQIPDPQALTISELETRYFDFQPQGFFSGVTPCTNYIDSSTGLVNSSLGRQTAAQWIRTAFRKFAPPRHAGILLGLGFASFSESVSERSPKPR